VIGGQVLEFLKKIIELQLQVETGVGRLPGLAD
jgi:hypothetical protein